nr:hypothetical protein BaRGS_019368 [Batillaria attramentaria]KAG5692744.1 hypothetical protein BaRGS_033855 [Batillaria attramentaria]
MERLSTTCLGAEVSVKPRPRLEPSCTYHVFPSEDMLTDAPTLFTSSMLWNPSKSTFERRPQVVHFDPGLNAPFKAVAGLRMKMSDKDQMVKEFINNMKPLNLSLNTEVPRAEIQRGLRGTATKPDLPATFELQGVSRDGRPVTQGEPRQRKGRLRHRDGDRKAHSASTTDTANSMRLKPTAADGERSDASTTATAAQQPSVPYFKFWNSSLPPRLKGDNQVKREQNGGRELNLREMAELMLANEQLPDGELQDLVRRRANQSPPSGPSIASGVYDAFNVTAPVMLFCTFV